MTRKRFFRSATVVALLAAPPVVHGQVPTSGTVRESESGTPFPVVMTPPGATTSHRLMGTGIREATLFKVNVYAFGLYVDAAGARAALAAFTGRQAAVLLRDARFNRRLLDLDFGMALRLVMTRTVDGSDVADAFDDALRPRMGNEGPALARLRRYLGVDAVRRGTEVVFACDAAGRMTIRVGEAEQPPFASRALCRALFDVYLGEDPISRDGRRDIVAGFAAWVAAGKRSASPDSTFGGRRSPRTPE